MGYQMWMAEDVGREQHRDRLRQAEAYRLARQASGSMPGYRERALLALGNSLIGLGESLKMRYQPCAR